MTNTPNAHLDPAGSDVARRLTDLGLTLPQVPTPLGVYVPALLAGDSVFTSGQLPLVNGALPATGPVGEGALTTERAAELARICALNALAAIGQVADLDQIRVVKVVGFVASLPTFTGQPSVVNGASELIGQVLGERGRHARSAVGVNALPMGAPVEVELIARLVRP